MSATACLSDREALLANARACQAEALLLLADEAADRGDEDRRRGYRWLAEEGRWPAHRVNHAPTGLPGGYWFWVPRTSLSFTQPEEVPHEAYALARGPGDVPCGIGFEEVLEWGALQVGRWLRETNGR